MAEATTAETLIGLLRDVIRRGRELNAHLARESDGDLLTEPLGALLSLVGAAEGAGAMRWPTGCGSPRRR